MRFLIAALASLLAVAAPAVATNDFSSEPLFSVLAPSERELENMFTAWMKQYDKVYSYEEFSHRFHQFKISVEAIREHNLKGTETYTMGLTEFADLSQDEFKNKYLTGLPQSVRSSKSRLLTLKSCGTDLPASIDWRTKGAVSPVVNQGSIGESWAFAAAGAIEGAWVAQGGHSLVSVSPAYLSDCCANPSKSVDGAFQCVIAAGGACSNYSTGQCDSCERAVTIVGYQDNAGENALLSAVGTTGPVAVGIEADQLTFQLYTGGVFSASCGTQVDHAMLAVGYGTDNGSDYWIVKNSWGSSWGEAGYIRLIRGKNECGIAGWSSNPIV